MIKHVIIGFIFAGLSISPQAEAETQIMGSLKCTKTMTTIAVEKDGEWRSWIPPWVSKKHGGPGAETETIIYTINEDKLMLKSYFPNGYRWGNDIREVSNVNFNAIVNGSPTITFTEKEKLSEYQVFITKKNLKITYIGRQAKYLDVVEGKAIYKGQCKKR